ncbi:hypothetical protein ACF1DY_09855 [Streptomyces albus]
MTERFRQGYGDATSTALEAGGDYERARDRAVRLAVAALGGLAPKAQPG